MAKKILKTNTVAPITPRKKRMSSFGATAYAYLGLLIDNPKSVLKKSQKNVADRFVENGWLEKVNLKIPQQIGAYEFEITEQTYAPTIEGLRQYEALRKLIDPNISIEQIKKIYIGEITKVALLKRMKDFE